MTVSQNLPHSILSHVIITKSIAVNKAVFLPWVYYHLVVPSSVCWYPLWVAYIRQKTESIFEVPDNKLSRLWGITNGPRTSRPTTKSIVVSTWLRRYDMIWPSGRECNSLVTGRFRVRSQFNAPVPFGKALYNPHYQVPWRWLKAVGPLVAYLWAYTCFSSWTIWYH